MNTDREKVIEQLEIEINLIKSKFDKLFNELSKLETEEIQKKTELLKIIRDKLDESIIFAAIYRF